MFRTFRVIRGRLWTGEFDRIDAVEALNLISLRLEPDVLDAGDLSGQGLDPVQRLILVVLGSGILPFVDHDVNHRLRLAEPVLRFNAAGMPGPDADACQKQART